MKKVCRDADDTKLRSLMRVDCNPSMSVRHGDPAEAFGLVLANKKDAILLDC